MFIVYCTWHLPHCNTLLQQCPQTALLPWHWRQTQNKRVYFYCLWEKTGEKNKLQTISWQCLSVTMKGDDSHRSNMFFIVVYLSSALTGSSGFSIYVQQLCANTSHWMKYKIKQSYSYSLHQKICRYQILYGRFTICLLLSNGKIHQISSKYKIKIKPYSSQPIPLLLFVG